MIMAVAHVAHDCQIGNAVDIANNVVMGGHVAIGDNAVIGGSAAIHQYVRIGRAAMIGGVAGVEADVIPFGTVLGNRARLVGLNVDRAAPPRLRAARRSRRCARRSGCCSAARACSPRAWRPRATIRRARPLVAEVLAFIDSAGPRGLIRSAAVADDEDAV